MTLTTAAFADELPTSNDLAVITTQIHHWLTAVPQHRHAILPTSGITTTAGNRLLTLKPIGTHDRPVLTMSVAVCLWVERTDVWTRLLNPVATEEIQHLTEHLHAVGLAHAAPQTNRHGNTVTITLDRPCLGSLYEAARRYTQGCPDHRDPTTGRGRTNCLPRCATLTAALGLLVLPQGFTLTHPTH